MREQAERPNEEGDVVSVTLRSLEIRDTQDQPLWSVIRVSTEALSFAKYATFHEAIPRRRSGWTARIASFQCLLLAIAFLLIGLLLGAILI